jgi:hypothetical protein
MPKWFQHCVVNGAGATNGYDLSTDPLGLFCTTAIAYAILDVPAGALAFLAAAAPLSLWCRPRSMWFSARR